MFLKQKKEYNLIQSVNSVLDSRIEQKRIREFGDNAKIRTVTREEGIKLAQFLRGEKETYQPFIFEGEETKD